MAHRVWFGVTAVSWYSCRCHFVDVYNPPSSGWGGESFLRIRQEINCSASLKLVVFPTNDLKIRVYTSFTKESFGIRMMFLKAEHPEHFIQVFSHAHVRILTYMWMWEGVAVTQKARILPPGGWPWSERGSHWAGVTDAKQTADQGWEKHDCALMLQCGELAFPSEDKGFWEGGSLLMCDNVWGGFAPPNSLITFSKDFLIEF